METPTPTTYLYGYGDRKHIQAPHVSPTKWNEREALCGAVGVPGPRPGDKDRAVCKRCERKATTDG